MEDPKLQMARRCETPPEITRRLTDAKTAILRQAVHEQNKALRPGDHLKGPTDGHNDA